MDPLDDIFAAMRVQSALYARLEARAPWGLSLNGGTSARFGLVVRGSCLLEVEGFDDPVPLAAGDCFVLAHGSAHVLRDHPLTPTVSCASAVRDRIGGTVELGGSGTAATVLCGWFLFDRTAATPLLDLLPTLLHVRMDQARAHALQGTLQLLAMETGEPGLGSGLVVSRLADILFVQAVRAHVASAGEEESGWLGALADARIGPALRAMHKDMARPWTVDTLASAALLSRSAFALRFRQRVGQSPLEYLTRWRMFKAANLLRQDGLSLGQVASQVGYESEAAFSKAFKRERGMGPGAWRRGSGATATQ
ncbi:AraC family transcriptional regulator [Ramlibacter sp.]|uniref:AraC family transcriptional regulator n=1 Tax=Ramlibacter sp. TaxID=1917967 RepID=UPI00180D2BCA|nr:AraC family transcriptional regulator [Ramlibacter sp.]MBA2676337.1 AraC family transcriptional regulator [Ramlibacter sp.]